MFGQWIGPVSGDLSGFIKLEIDDEQTFYRGTFQFFQNEYIPQSICNFSTKDKSTNQSIEVALRALNLQGALLPEEVGTHFREQMLLGNGHLSLAVEKPISLVFELESGGRRIEGILTGTEATSSSNLVPESSVRDWRGFKAYIQDLKKDDQIFRGQSSPRRLRTAFHRTRRSDIWRYTHLDLRRVYRNLSPLLSRNLDLNNPDELSSFMNLLQHHGFPTPLLDWTYSPYIAAFFAFRNSPREPDQIARIFLFEARAWSENYIALNAVAGVHPHITITELSGIGNVRMLPQQSIHMYTNIDNIEGFIADREIEVSRRYITAFDLPFSERELVLSDLRYMGITAATMFPGLDGSCEAIKNDILGF